MSHSNEYTMLTHSSFTQSHLTQLSPDPSATASIINANNSSSISSSSSSDSPNRSSSIILDSNSYYSSDIKHRVKLRFLCPEDINELKTLCAEWFPVDYPDSWFNDITSSGRFYSLAAELNGRLIGILVAEIKLKKVTDREEYVLLSSRHHENTQITYILSLGVHQEFRRLGIASMLLDTLTTYLKNETDCKAIYLHVLWSNTNAIRFYEKRHFQRRIFLPKYYTIKGQFQDGYCYVLYMNNGQPPMTITYPFIRFYLYLKSRLFWRLH